MSKLNQTHEIKMQPANGGTVVEHIVSQITDMITAGRFFAGKKLPTEYELMEELNVSRNSLREAMKILSAIGIVDIRRGDGTYICNKAKPNIFDSITLSLLLESSSETEIIELRQTLDESVLNLAIRKCTQTEIDHLQAMIYQMQDDFWNGKVSEAAKLDYQFHLYLTNCSRNRFLIRIVTGVYRLFEGSIENNILTEELFAMADQHHQEILDCLRARDESRVREVISRSLSSWKRNIKDKI